MYKSIFCIPLFLLFHIPLNAQSDNTVAFIDLADEVGLYEVADEARSDHLNQMYASLSFPGGHQKLINYITKNLVYPEIAIENGIEGVVRAKASFDEMGRLINATIERSLMKECDAAVLLLLNQMPAWYPEIFNGKAIPKTLILPFSFKLQ